VALDAQGAIFTLAANGVCPEHFVNLAANIAAESTLAEDVGPRTGPLGKCADQTRLWLIGLVHCALEECLQRFEGFSDQVMAFDKVVRSIKAEVNFSLLRLPRDSFQR
jgi:hypothetical protein